MIAARNFTAQAMPSAARPAAKSENTGACREIREHRRLPPSEVDDLMLDVREADAAGLSYGQWRAQKLMGKLKASDARKKKKP